MVGILKKAVVAGCLDEGIQSIIKHRGGSAAQIRKQICDSLGIGVPVLDTWQHDSRIPYNIAAAELMGLCWLVHQYGALDWWDWFIRLLKGTDMPVPDPPALNLIHACINFAQVYEFGQNPGPLIPPEELIRRLKLGIDTDEMEKMWEKRLNQSRVQQVIHPLGSDCAWVMPWQGLMPDQVQLEYQAAPVQRYDRMMPETVKQALEDWQANHPTIYAHYQPASWGSMVRLEQVVANDPPGDPSLKPRIQLSPITFPYYLAIHARLGETPLWLLRQKAFQNALDGLNSRQPLQLPSHFAIHMVIRSSDGYVLLRQRRSDTHLYPRAWDASLGKFMKGPDVRAFPHFNAAGKPDLSAFLRNAVAEELDYKEHDDSRFRLYGFAVERASLAPKLLVVYKSVLSIADLKKQSSRSADPSTDQSAVELTPAGIVGVYRDSQYQNWTPCSHLGLMLALRETVDDQDALLREVSRLLA
jgi:hypothetical protein